MRHAVTLVVMSVIMNTAAVAQDAQRPNEVWAGFYAGLNLGYGFGLNSNSYSPSFDTPLNTLAINGDAGTYYLPVSIRNSAASSLTTMSGGTQSGVFGGGQAGYNYQLTQHLLLGIEADMQGSGIEGINHSIGGGKSSTQGGMNAFKIVSVQTPQGIRYIQVPMQVVPNTNNLTSLGSTSTHAGVDWMGTARARIGYLVTPNTLIYGTGGITFGGINAQVNQYVSSNLDSYSNIDGTLLGGSKQTYIGGGQLNKTLVGWNGGGGFEWMFSPNWSLKAEAIYWNMGSVDVQVHSIALPSVFTAGPCPGAQCSPQATWGSIQVNYQGIIARTGVNYHFTVDSVRSILQN